MNQIFCFKRYVWLLKRQWYENAAIYKWGIVLMVLVIGLLFWLSGSWKSVDYPILEHEVTFYLTIILFLYLYGAYFFESLHSKHKGMIYFSLPVSSLERVAVVFTYVMALMPVLMLAVYTLFDYISVQLFNHIHGTSIQMFFKKPYPDGLNGETLYVVLLIFLTCTSIFALNSLIFGKKGQVISVIFIILYLYVQYKIIGPAAHGEFIINGVIVYLLPICWAAMYFVMKRKQAYL